MLYLALSLSLLASFQEPRPDLWTSQDYPGSPPFATVTIWQHGFMGEPPSGQDWEVAFNRGPDFAWSTPVYQAMRMREGRVERVRSDVCDFGPMLLRIQEMAPGDFDIPGVLQSPDQIPGPPVLHARTTYVLRAEAPQAAGGKTRVQISASDGALAEWAEALKGVLDECDWEIAPTNPNVLPHDRPEQG